MRIIDTHCDALLKLWEDPTRNFLDDESIDANATRLANGEVMAQCFAIFVEPFIKSDDKFQAALEQIDLFHEKVLKTPSMRWIQKWSDLDHLQHDEIGAILTLEGLDSIGDDLVKLRLMYQLGVLSVGLTWNQANLCADGIGEERGAGLTTLGKEVVRMNNEKHVLTDVSHLSVKGFWDVMELANYPIASHSNAFSLCDHRRNLQDEQIKALVKKNGYIGVVFHPLFVTGKEEATIADLLTHIEYMCSLGATKNIGFGSDFDGINVNINQLEHAGHYDNLMNALLRYYPEEVVRGFAGENFSRMLPKGAHM
ncbi:dipeptidase [Bacillus sp. FJAT-45037]|uniref:dipeptidase n=1 Tax=Bacillus sp. FJAT-45037 TaxID=2011007 RepID=UPI000C2385F3|nr:dipeptidase [Bacillus sp. FJAT-45037]